MTVARGRGRRRRRRRRNHHSYFMCRVAAVSVAVAAAAAAVTACFQVPAIQRTKPEKILLPQRTTDDATRRDTTVARLASAANCSFVDPLLFLHRATSPYRSFVMQYAACSLALTPIFSAGIPRHETGEVEKSLRGSSLSSSAASSLRVSILFVQ